MSLVFFALLLLNFLNPFADLMLVKFSGLQLAMGRTNAPLLDAFGSRPEEIQPNEQLLLALIAGLVGLAASVDLRAKDRSSRRTTSTVRVLASCAAIYGLLAFYGSLANVPTLARFMTDWFWAAVALAAIALAVGVAGLVDSFRS